MPERGPAVISFNEDGSLPPVVFCHTWDQEIHQLTALAEYLGPDQPLYGIEPPPSIEGQMPTTTDDWVAFFRPVLDTLPVGPPYRVAGFSYAGIIAMEVARQLQHDGIEVAWLGLVDAMRPRLNPKGLRRYVRYQLSELRELPGTRYRWRYVCKLWESGGPRTKLRIKVKTYRVLAALHLVKAKPRTIGQAKGMSPLHRAVARGYLSHETRPYEGSLAVFSGPSARESSLGDVSLRWTGYVTGDLEVTEIQGRHRELFTPENIHSIGEAMRASLARAHGTRSTRPNASRPSR